MDGVCSYDSKDDRWRIIEHFLLHKLVKEQQNKQHRRLHTGHVFYSLIDEYDHRCSCDVNVNCEQPSQKILGNKKYYKRNVSE